MLEGEFVLQAINSIHEAFHSLHSGMSSSSNSNGITAVAVGIAITAVAGVAVAAAVGGTLLYSRRVSLKHRRRKPLTRSQWQDAFEAESGRLIDVEKLLKKIRNGGMEPSIRAEVWPFLLGLYRLESTCVERETEKVTKREEYDTLRNQCLLLLEEIKYGSRKDEETKDGLSNTRSLHDLMSVSPEPVKEDLEEESASISLIDESPEAITPMDVSCSDDDRETSVRSEGCPDLGDTLVNKIDRDSSHVKLTTQVIEEFTTWQRIIRLDAVRMNAEWIPYSPSQANVNMEIASDLALAVGLKDDEHLEPCRKHHAARLVAILEAYALYDKETGYCQGMSDLLSPFVALIDEDCEAFWCFVYFMRTARHNFRLDEIGIRRQLIMVSKILKFSDPHLYQHLEKVHAENCFFVYRMVVVLLRRELSFEQTISLWEVIWADRTAIRWGKVKTSWRKGRRRNLPTNYLLLYVIAAAVRLKRKFIMEKCKGIDDILRLCNGMAGHLDVWALLDDARELVNALHDKITD